jgi:Tfp pilus assembly protein PilF
MEQRVRADSNDADAHLVLARAYRTIEHQQRALRHYGIYLQLRPQASAVSKEAEEYFQTLRAEGAKLLPESVLPEPL